MSKRFPIAGWSDPDGGSQNAVNPFDSIINAFSTVLYNKDVEQRRDDAGTRSCNLFCSQHRSSLHASQEIPGSTTRMRLVLFSMSDGYVYLFSGFRYIA